MKILRAVPNIKSDRPAETRAFFVELLGFGVAMDQGWVVTVAAPTRSAPQITIVAGDDPGAPGISVEVDDVDAVHARAVEQGYEIAYPLRDEAWGVRRFMLREPSGTMVNVLSHLVDPEGHRRDHELQRKALRRGAELVDADLLLSDAAWR